MDETRDWPEEALYTPTPEELTAERQELEAMARIAEYEAWLETQVALLDAEDDEGAEVDEEAA